VVPIGGSVTQPENLRLTEVNQVGVSVGDLDNTNPVHLDRERKDVKDVLNTDMQHPPTDQPSAVKRKKKKKKKIQPQEAEVLPQVQHEKIPAVTPEGESPTERTVIVETTPAKIAQRGASVELQIVCDTLEQLKAEQQNLRQKVIDLISDETVDKEPGPIQRIETDEGQFVGALPKDDIPDARKEPGSIIAESPPSTVDDSRTEYQEEQVANGIGRTFSILKTGTSSMLRMPVSCNKRPIVAVIDTAAEVTIMSDKIFQALKNKPPILRKTVMYAAGRGMQMDTMVVGPVDLEINNKIDSTLMYM